jgi:exosortase B
VRSTSPPGAVGAAPIDRFTRGWLSGLDPVVATTLVIGFGLLFAPLLWDWTQGQRASGLQGHEPAIFAVSAFLLYRKRRQLAALPTAAVPIFGGLFFVFGLLLYLLGRAYDIRIALFSLMVLLVAVLLCFKGLAALRVSWFAILFPLFAMPLPLELVLAVTGPMKIGVSSVATQLLSWLGYPIGRSGVVITIGQYQLLVTEACAGLQTMFTLEAMGLLYASLMNHSSALRNVLLAILVVPIAFLANVIRVALLALITFHFGDAAGQGFLHGFSGMVLFLVALVLVIVVDELLGRVLRRGAPA